MSKADLSVLITCYNKEAYIDEAIKSILENTIKPLEIILVHDGCDNPVAHVHAKTLILPKNVGVVKSRDEAVRLSKGNLLLFLDGDDKLPPNFIQKCILEMPKADIVYPDMFLWYVNTDKNIYMDAPNTINPTVFFTKCGIPVSSMMKRNVYTELGGFGDYPVYEDWEFWLRALSKGYKFRRGNTFLYYRQIPNTRNRQGNEIKEQVYAMIKKKYHIVKGKICQKPNTTS
jgi:glycosyltransferase involved in cell wall biosynthesis